MRCTIDFLVSVTLLSLFSCSCDGWSREEHRIVNVQTEVMRVLTVDEPNDEIALRSHSLPISGNEMNDDVFESLCRKMVLTVTDPEYDGVGIAAPQVGILRRIVAVQRFDKEGEPFEVYPNIEIISFNGDMEPGSEGCLSVPGRRGTVSRYRDIDIRYSSMATHADTVENVKGFTAVIFQHECDHLDGIIYTDRADSVFCKVR